MKDPYSIVKSPVISEKGTRLSDEENKYIFKVDRRASKIDIRRAIEQIYKVHVACVNTMIVRGKIKRYRWQRGKIVWPSGACTTTWCGQPRIGSR